MCRAARPMQSQTACDDAERPTTVRRSTYDHIERVWHAAQRDCAQPQPKVVWHSTSGGVCPSGPSGRKRCVATSGDVRPSTAYRPTSGAVRANGQKSVGDAPTGAVHASVVCYSTHVLVHRNDHVALIVGVVRPTDVVASTHFRRRQTAPIQTTSHHQFLSALEIAFLCCLDRKSVV